MSLDHEEALKGETIKDIRVTGYGVEILTESKKYFEYDACSGETALTYIDPVSGQEVGSYDISI